MSKRGGSHFFQTEEFRRLNEIWVAGKNSKLKKAGFEDIERRNGSLKAKNTRTQAYLEQENLSRISSALIFYIENSPHSLKSHEKQILKLHAEGTYQKRIKERTGKSHDTVWRVIKKHTPLALGLYAEAEESDLLLSHVEIDPFSKE